jgi:ribosomal protein S18 acetylase RimI-like enzyme
VDVRTYEPEDRDALVDLVQAVSGTGGAVGWLSVPTPEEIDAWIASIRGELVVTDGACGIWTRRPGEVMRGQGEVTKVMTHPQARGRGAGAAVMTEIVRRATAAGLELLTLECRGNNHGAQRLYARCGFVVTGRRPDAIAVGDERFDQVLMHLDLRQGPSGLVRHGSRNEGPGAT